jgi:hypothetical protein
MNQKDYSKFTLKLNPAFEWEGKTYREMTFDFGRLTGEDFTDVDREMKDSGEWSLTSVNTDMNFLYRLAAKAAGIGSDVVKKLPANKFNAVLNSVRRFLNSAESEMSEGSDESAQD